MSYEKYRSVTNGTVTVKGTDLAYIATAEDFPIRNDAGDPDATMFTFSYELDGIATEGRPVLFGWNGGPGCGSLFVHMGLFSPMKVKCGNGYDLPQTAPFALTVNENCLLDTCDVVAVDAIGTGYSRLINQEAKSTYCSTEKDAETFIRTIRMWLTAHDRWNSPIYIMGESYGTIRCALVAEGMFYTGVSDKVGSPLHISGVILLGTALNYGQRDFPLPTEILNLPSIAAANWYWNPEGKGALMDFINECERFCYDEYARALALGNRLPQEEKERIADKLSRYTGYQRDQLLASDLSIDVFRYPVDRFAADHKSIGMYDARFSLGAYRSKEPYDYFSDDASNSFSMPAFTVGFNGLWKKQLGIKIEEEYAEIWTEAEKSWNFNTKKPPIHSLENAMHRNPNMKLMFGMGCYDMLTTIGAVRYLTSHSLLPEDRTWLRYYESGHMPYLGDQLTYQLEDDIKAFIRAERNENA